MPRNSQSAYIAAPNWDNPRKIEARREAIIEPFRRFFGPTIPAGSQHWTMCGAHYTAAAGELKAVKGELGQMLESGILEPHQFFGVDKEEEVIKKNRAVLPGVSWILGDFMDEMERAAYEGNFNPAIINYDGVSQSKAGVIDLTRIMRLVDSSAAAPLLLAANFVLRNPYMPRGKNSDRSDPGYEIIDRLVEKYAVPDHWSLLGSYFRHRGGASSRGHAVMGYLTLIKERHNPSEYYATPGRQLF